MLELVASHGAAYVARDSERLKNLRTGAMVHYLNTVRLSAESRRALAILSTVSPLPLPIFKEIIGAKNFRLPLDHSWTPPLVVPAANGLYAIASPVEDFVERDFRLRRINEEIGRIASALKGYIDSLSEEDWAEAGVLEAPKLSASVDAERRQHTMDNAKRRYPLGKNALQSEPRS